MKTRASTVAGRERLRGKIARLKHELRLIELRLASDSCSSCWGDFDNEDAPCFAHVHLPLKKEVERLTAELERRLGEP